MKLLHSLFNNFCYPCTTYVHTNVQVAVLHFILIASCFPKSCFNIHGILTHAIHCPATLLLNKGNWLSQTLQIIPSVFMSHKEQSFEDFEPRGILTFQTCKCCYSASCVIRCTNAARKANTLPGMDYSWCLKHTTKI